jgi:drug/metabolite transporter (DMT)-like permease
LNITHNGYFFAVSAALIWSGFILASRAGGISELNAFDVIAIRYVVCALVVLPFWWFKFRFNLLDPKLIVCSLIGGMGYALFTFQGFQLASASQAAILLPGLLPLFILLCSMLINNERPTSNKIVGIFIITVGVAVLLVPMLMQNSSIGRGQLYLMAGGLCWAIFSVLVKRWEVSPWQATASVAILTCVLYMPFYLAFAPKQFSLELWRDIALQSFYQGFLATVVQMLLYVKAVQLIGPSSMGAVMAIVPIVSGIGAIYLFNESASSTLIIALFLVSIGSLLVHYQFKTLPLTNQQEG